MPVMNDAGPQMYADAVVAGMRSLASPCLVIRPRAACARWRSAGVAAL
jgi:hypothetical protein